MIDRDEITAKGEEFGIHPSDVQRDYVLGWLICGLFEVSALGDLLALKGGNALRKAYLPSTRFSDDLDVTTTQGLDGQRLLEELNRICRFAEERSGVQFDLARNRLVGVQQIDRARQVYKLRAYFRDFSGGAEHLTLKVRVDVTEYDRIQLPLQTRRLIHPYSDTALCTAEIRAVKLEEALADKLKCLLQRRYAYDLFDLAYGVFVARELDVDRSEIVRTFLRKTIFEPSPVTACSLLLATPFELMRGFWNRLVAPKAARLSFDRAVSLVKDGLRALFEPFSYGEHLAAAYFPAEFRNPILQAAGDMTLLQVTYDGITREVEPYSLAFKRRRDGVAQEYFYGWDRTGGHRSGPGIKAFLQGGIQQIANTDEPFEPRFEVELAKAGDRDTEGYFGRPFAAQRRVGMLRRGRPRRARMASGPRWTVQCTYCGKRFSRSRPSTRLNPHKDPYGNSCPGRVGFLAS